MLDTIHQKSHTVKTAYQESNLTYGGDTITKKFKKFVMRLFRGKICASQFWSIIISVVLSAPQTQGLGILFVNSFTMEIAQLVGLSYIDDCDIVQLDDNIDATDLQMQLTMS